MHTEPATVVRNLDDLGHGVFDDVRFLLHRSCFAGHEGLESLTASPRAFNVPDQLTVTGVVPQDLALVQTLHLQVPLQGIKAPQKWVSFRCLFKKCPTLSKILAAVYNPQVHYLYTRSNQNNHILCLQSLQQA